MKKTMMKVSALAMVAMMAVPSLAMAEAPEVNLEEREVATVEMQTDEERQPMFGDGKKNAYDSFTASFSGYYTIFGSANDGSYVRLAIARPNDMYRYVAKGNGFQTAYVYISAGERININVEGSNNVYVSCGWRPY